jgi:hypothetical protein
MFSNVETGVEKDGKGLINVQIGFDRTPLSTNPYGCRPVKNDKWDWPVSDRLDNP